MNTCPEFISVGELEKGFAAESNLLPEVEELAGQRLMLHFDNGDTVQCRFADAHALIWEVLAALGQGCSHRERYRATSPRPGIYFVDFLMSGKETATSASLVLDLERGVFTQIIGNMPTRAETALPMLQRIAAGSELTGVTVSFLQGTVGGFSGAERHQPATDLIGKRIEYTYSPTERYEHIYLNGNYYAWHCLEGSEKGLCDVDRCHYYKIAENLYLFVWREKIVPTLGIVMVDLERMRTTGKIFGYQGYDFGSLSNFPVGATARVLTATI